ncbi:hypothetical protein ACLQ24_14145 [Micromonospora sp. DT4]|uniref:hypothetical protein n=1 Tax=Micromonospora sp. DT4 TaxID=3393438 RepID=UPI003CF03F24
MRATARGWTAVWWVVLALVQAAAFLAVWRVARSPLTWWWASGRRWPGCSC